MLGAYTPTETESNDILTSTHPLRQLHQTPPSTSAPPRRHLSTLELKIVSLRLGLSTSSESCSLALELDEGLLDVQSRAAVSASLVGAAEGVDAGVAVGEEGREGGEQRRDGGRE